MRPTPALKRSSGKPSDPGQRDNGDRDGAERYRRGVRKQADGGGIERSESETGQHGGCNRHRSSETGCAFHERSEGETRSAMLEDADRW